MHDVGFHRRQRSVITHQSPVGRDLITVTPGLKYPVAALFHSAYAGDVVLTMVGGHVLYRDGAFTTIDWPALVETTLDMGLDRGWAP